MSKVIQQSCFVVVSGAGSGMCELTNQRRLGLFFLKRQEPFRQRGDTMLQRWTVWDNWCFSLALKHVNNNLVVMQNTIMNIKMSMSIVFTFSLGIMKMSYIWVAAIYEWVQFDPNKHPDVYVNWYWIRLDWIKGDCWALVEVYALLSAITIYL